MEEFSRGFDIRILQVSISLGTKFQRNQLGRFRAPASLWKGVDVSAISSVQTVWWDVSACICWRDAFFFGQRRTSERKLCAWKLRTTISKRSSRLWRGTKHVLALPALGQGVWGSAFNESPNQAPRPWSWPKQLHVPGPTEFAHSKISGNIMPIVIFEHMAPSSCVRTK